MADIGRVGRDIGIATQEAFGLPGSRIGNADRGSFRQTHLEEELRTGGGREELLLDQAEARKGDSEHGEGDQDHRHAPAQAQFNQGAKPPIEAGVVDRFRILMMPSLCEIWQQLEPQIGREHHGDDP